MSQEEPAQGGGVDAPFQIGVVEIVAGEIAQLFGHVFVLVAQKGGGLRGADILLPVLGEEVERLDRVGEGKRGLVLEVFAGYVEQVRHIRVAERGTGGIQDARSKKSEGMFEEGGKKRVILVQRRCYARGLAAAELGQAAASLM